MKNMCHRARIFVLVTFLKNPEKKIKTIISVVSRFNQFFVCLRPMYITGRRHSYEGGSMCNVNPIITPSTNALGSYAICQTKDQSVTVKMVHETLFYLSKLISYTLFKKHTNIHCIYFPPNCKDSFQQR